MGPSHGSPRASGRGYGGPAPPVYNQIMGIEQGVIDEIVRCVTSAVPAQRIILFGSAATGQMTQDSDIDLLVVNEKIEDPWAERLAVRRSLKDLAYPFDIILMTTARFEETKGVIGGIAYPANKHGKTIYETA